MATTFKERLEFAFRREQARRLDAGEPRLTKTDLWKAAGATSAAATHWFNGSNGMDLDTCMKVAPLLKCNPYYLFDGLASIDDTFLNFKSGSKSLTDSELTEELVGSDWENIWSEPKLLPSSNINRASPMSESNAEEAPGLSAFKRVPVVGTAQLGDNGYWAELETPVGFGDGYIPFPAKGKNTYALRCRGDSMKPRIKDGEFVIVDPERVPDPGDDVLVKARDGRVMVKQLLYIRDETVHLMSVNEAHGKLSIRLEDIECMHFVVAIMPRGMWERG